jgi:hypothetical protein
MPKKPDQQDPKEKSTESVDPPKASNRRKILKGTLAGVGAIGASGKLPTTWTKPVTDSVLLPAHAQTTQPEECGLRAQAFFVGDSTWNGDIFLDRTAFLPFECGTSGEDLLTNSCSQDISLFLVNIALDRPPGSAGTATVDVQTNIGDNEDASADFDANQTDLEVFVDSPGSLSDQGDYTITVNVPGFQTARLRLNIFCD